jgi:hypothetical protein
VVFRGEQSINEANQTVHKEASKFEETVNFDISNLSRVEISKTVNHLEPQKVIK